MKKAKYICVLITILLFCTISISCSEVNKAKEFMDAGMYPQAIALLETEIANNPADAEAHYQLGVCYINQKNIRSADKRFTSAVKLKSDYGFKIGKEYEKVADDNLSKGKLMSSLYDKAIQYTPALKQSIASHLFNVAKEGKGNVNAILSKAVLYDNGLKDKIVEHYYSLSQQASGEKSLVMLQKANQLSGKYKSEIGRKYLELAHMQVTREEIEEHIKKSSKYLSEENICDILFELAQDGKHENDSKSLEKSKGFCSKKDSIILQILVKTLPGKTLTINLKPKEVRNVGSIHKGRKNFRYLYFDEPFEHQICRNQCPSSAWAKIDNNQPWSASWAGTIYIKAGNKPTKVIVNIKP